MTHEASPRPAAPKQPTVEEIQKSLDSLATFDRWMDEQLEALVAEWIHAAAPNAERGSFRSSLSHR